MASKIEDYGFISNMRTGALVSRTADIEWLCPPRFDADACFASLLGYDEHGRWSMRPAEHLKEVRQRYRGDTLVLETEFVCDGGSVRITDFMPISREGRCDVFRVLEGLEGEVQVETLLDVRFGFGANAPLVTRHQNGVRFTAGPDSMELSTNAAVDAVGSRVAAYLKVKKGERIPFRLSWHASHEPGPEPLDAQVELARTLRFWEEWASRCTYQGPHREAVMRSLLTLKGLTYAPTGGIVAALTTSLPEELGGVRNWDYRYCWVRDASLTLDALMIGGYSEEASAFRDWLFRATAGDPANLQIMYDIHGGRRLSEFELDWLPGYEGSHPVRVGNAAWNQFQLDIYGEVFSCLFAARKLGLGALPGGEQWLRAAVDFVERAWQQPDDGIWEVRGGRRHFTHSKVMAWVAIDRVIRTHEELGSFGSSGPTLIPHLRTLRSRMHKEICERGYNPLLQSFTQSYASDALDASLLILPHVGFLPATDPRMLGTVAAIEKQLLRDGFVLRYSTETGADGLPGTEGAFLACSFWLADNYAYQGRLDEADQLFDRLLGLRNHLGLLAEEYDPNSRRQLGNFPQAFSHLALIFTANAIDRAREGRTVVRAA